MGGLRRASLWLGKKQDSARMGHEKSATPKREIYKKERGVVMVGIMMPMPKSCEDCPCNDHDAWCGITLTEFGDDFCKIRLPDCPLIDITDDGK